MNINSDYHSRWKDCGTKPCALRIIATGRLSEINFCITETLDHISLSPPDACTDCPSKKTTNRATYGSILNVETHEINPPRSLISSLKKRAGTLPPEGRRGSNGYGLPQFCHLSNASKVSSKQRFPSTAILSGEQRL